jgi:hypothetical protein
MKSVMRMTKRSTAVGEGGELTTRWTSQERARKRMIFQGRALRTTKVIPSKPECFLSLSLHRQLQVTGSAYEKEVD